MKATLDKYKASLTRLIKSHGGVVFILSLVISLFLHLFSAGYLSRYDKKRWSQNDSNRQQVKVRVVSKSQSKNEPSLSNHKKILETPQKETQAPKQADHAGQQNHIAEKETRVKPQITKAKDPGQRGTSGNANDATIAKKSQPQQGNTQTPNKPKLSMQGLKNFVTPGKEPRNQYEKFLPYSMNDLQGQMSAGYQDHLDESIVEGDRIDINTSEYRYIGYFTGMRKAIELVWIYPEDAIRKGLQGATVIEFMIDSKGHASRIKVLKSSGYAVLDRGIIDAIRMASPFSPLPKGFGKDQLLVVGAFSYVLQSYGSH